MGRCNQDDYSRFGGSTVVIGTEIYTIGGIGIDSNSNGEINVSRALEKYSTKTDTWTELAQLPIINSGNAFEEKLGVAFGTAQYVNVGGRDYIYVLSGVSQIDSYSTNMEIDVFNKYVFRYCIEEDEWTYSEVVSNDNGLLKYQRE